MLVGGSGPKAAICKLMLLLLAALLLLSSGVVALSARGDNGRINVLLLLLLLWCRVLVLLLPAATHVLGLWGGGAGMLPLLLGPAMGSKAMPVSLSALLGCALLLRRLLTTPLAMHCPALLLLVL